MTELKILKTEITEYVDKENIHLEDKLNNRFQSLEKWLDNIDATIKNIDCRIYNDAQLREIAFQESSSAIKKFWSNFKWFIGIVIVTVMTMFTVGIVTWADVRDYITFKKTVIEHITTSSEKINNLEKKHLTDTIRDDLDDIKINLIEIKNNLESE